jgi:hypothetical protein
MHDRSGSYASVPCPEGTALRFFVSAARLIPEHRLHRRLPRDPSRCLARCIEMTNQELGATEPLARALDGTDLTPLIKALAMLGSDLDLAFDCNPERVSSEDERFRYTNAVRALAMFLQACGDKHASRVWRLAMALDDLNDGVTDPLLKAKRTGGSRGNTWRWCARANVALGIYVLVEASLLSRKEAAEKAAKDYPGINKVAAFERGIKSDTKTKILGWYDEFKKDRHKTKINSVAVSLFEEGRKLIDPAVQDFMAGGQRDALFRLADHFFRRAIDLRK